MEERKMKPRPRKSRRKVCGFCVDKVEHIDYKDTARLRKYVSERGKIMPRRMREYAQSISASWPSPSSAPASLPFCPT